MIIMYEYYYHLLCILLVERRSPSSFFNNVDMSHDKSPLFNACLHGYFFQHTRRMAGRSIFKRRKPFVAKRKNKVSIFQPWKLNPKSGCLEATCVLCSRHFVALDSSQLHLVAPSSGKCYYCRQHASLADPEKHDHYNVNHAISDERLYDRIGVAHEGRWRDKPEQVDFTFEATVIGKLKTPLPHWSCCKNSIRLPSQPGNRCPTAARRENRVRQEKEKEAEAKYKAYNSRLHGRDKLTKNMNMPKIPASMMRTRSQEQRNRNKKDLDEKLRLKELEDQKKNVKDFEKAFAISSKEVESQEDFKVVDISPTKEPFLDGIKMT